MPTVQTLSGNTVAISYITRDFESYREDILGPGGLADLYTPNWTDRSELDLGVAMVEGFSFFGQNISFYQDRNLNEAFWSSAVQRRSVIEHCKLLSYTLSPNTSAQVELTVVTTDSGTVPAGAQVQVDTTDGSAPATFELESDFVSTGSGTYTGIIAVHGTTVYSEPIGTSSGSPGQKFTLKQTPLTMNPSGSSSLQVWVDEGTPVEWVEVTSFLESESTDKVFRVEIDEYDKVTVIFGDDVNGKAPASAASISATYRVGGGYSGNQVGKNRLTRLGGSYSFVTSVTNPEKPSGGLDKETIEEAKKNAPGTFKAMNRAVTHDDYGYLARAVPGVSKAFAYQGSGAYDEMVVIAAGGENPVPTGEWDPYTATGSGLLGAVGAYLEVRKTTPVILHTVAANPVDMRLTMTVYGYPNSRKEDLERSVTTEVVRQFSINNQDFGREVPLSRVSDVVEDIPNVDYLNVTRFQRVPWARKKTGAADLTFSSMVYGSNTVRDRWTVQFSGPTTFAVSGANSGQQLAVGVVGSPFLVDDGSFGFTVSGGPPTTGDKWEIVTGIYVGNIQPDFDELCRLLDGTFSLNVIVPKRGI